MAKIRFEIFRNRKRFNIINWLKKSKDRSYESFESFLTSKSVLSPGKEYFQKALALLDSMEEREKQFQESKKQEAQTDINQENTVSETTEMDITLPPVQEDLSVENSTEELVVPEELPKPKTRRRRRKKE